MQHYPQTSQCGEMGHQRASSQRPFPFNGNRYVWHAEAGCLDSLIISPKSKTRAFLLGMRHLAHPFNPEGGIL